MFGLSSNILAGQRDTQKYRIAPSRPTLIAFPSPQPSIPRLPSLPSSWMTRPTGICHHFLNLRKPGDVDDDTLSILNVTFLPECDIETLLSSLSSNAEPHLPPKSWLRASTDDEPLPSTALLPMLLCNGQKHPDQNDFQIRARELFFNNDEAFSSLARKTCPGKTPLRLVHFRRFWEGLDNMACYWDTSMDEYIPSYQSASIGMGANDTKPMVLSYETESREDAYTFAVNATASTESFASSTFDTNHNAANTESVSSNQLQSAHDSTSKAPQSDEIQAQIVPAEHLAGCYRGYRIGNGAEMPDQYRIDCVQAFLEPIAWAFGMRLLQRRHPSSLTLGPIRFPVRISLTAWKVSQDQTKARQGWKEGPVLGVQCRADVDFSSTDGRASKSALDAIREIGGLLLLAQERAREGLTEKRGGEGKWWTTKARWGGYTRGNTTDLTKENRSSELRKDGLREKNRERSKSRRRPTPIESWSTLKSNDVLWDTKVTYAAIGKDRSVEWDDIFMISSLNHHISVLKFRVHPFYLRYLTDGILPENTSSDMSWCSPKLHRTRWFDLFDAGDRAEAMRCIWGILSYLMRATEGGGDEGNIAR